MQPFFYGALFFAAAWFFLAPHDWVQVTDSSWFNETTGLDNHDAAIVLLFFLVGLQFGALAKNISDLADSHNKLIDKVYGQSDE